MVMAKRDATICNLKGVEGRLLQVEGSCAVSVRGVDFSERDLDVVEREVEESCGSISSITVKRSLFRGGCIFLLIGF